MKNKIRFVLSAIVISIFLLTFFANCSKTPAPSEIALSYYDLIIKQDSQGLEALGMPSETAASIIAELKENLTGQITNSLSIDSPTQVSKEQLESIQAAYFNALHKLNATATFVQSGHCCEVTLSTTCLDFKALNEWATDHALAQVDILNYIDKDLYLTDLTSTYIDYLVEAYENATPEASTNEATFTFTKRNGLWLPEDYEAFASKLCDLIILADD